MRVCVSALVLVTSLVLPVHAQETFSPDSEGFIRNWLVLAPIPMAGQSGADEIYYDLLGGEGAITPRPAAVVAMEGRQMAWTPHRTFAYYIDFRESFDKSGGEYVVGYAVTYIHADAPMELTLALGTNDQGKAWFNGREVMSVDETRVLGKDDNRIPVSLVAGQNVLVLKVINEVNSWQACARFLKDGKPVTDLTIALTPK